MIEHEIIVRTRDGKGRMLDTAITVCALFDNVLGVEGLLNSVMKMNENKFDEKA